MIAKNISFELIAERMGRIKPSPTLAVNSLATRLKAEGHDVIDLGVGEPDFDTPENIKQAAIQAIKQGKTKYTPVDGTIELKKAIIGKFARENDLHYTPGQITVSTGAKQVLFNALLASVNPGEEVIIPAPYWVSYPDMVAFAEGKPVIVSCPADKGFKLQPEQLEKAITANTKWLILNSPSNPTGAAYTEDELQSLAQVLLRHPHVQIMSDDIYEHIVFDGFEFKTIAQVEPRLFSRTLTVNGVSKSYAMTGWRIGYAGGDEALIKAMAKIQSQSTSNPCSISQAAAVEALNGTQEFLAINRETFEERRNMVLDLLNKIPGINCNSAEGAFYLFPSCEGLIGKRTPEGKIINSCGDFAAYLLEKGLVAAVQGAAFGMPNFFRISYATSNEVLKEACHRIAKVCASLS
jgi:aspartate aminotransferase